MLEKANTQSYSKDIQLTENGNSGTSTVLVPLG